MTQPAIIRQSSIKAIKDVLSGGYPVVAIETWEEDSIIYDENTPAKYIKFTAIEQFLSDADLKRINKTNKLSISDIKRIEEYINNPKYSLDFDNIDILEYKESIKKTKKKN